MLELRKSFKVHAMECESDARGEPYASRFSVQRVLYIRTNEKQVGGAKSNVGNSDTVSKWRRDYVHDKRCELNTE